MDQKPVKVKTEDDQCQANVLDEAEICHTHGLRTESGKYKMLYQGGKKWQYLNY